MIQKAIAESLKEFEKPLASECLKSSSFQPKKRKQGKPVYKEKQPKL